MSAPDFANFLASLGGNGLTGPPPMPSVPVQGPMPLPAVPTPGPVQPMAIPQHPASTPQMTAQHGAALQDAIGPLAAIALALSGHPYAATGAAQGALLASETRKRDQERQTQLALEYQQRQLEQAKFLYDEEQKRQAGIAALVEKTQAQIAAMPGLKKDDYDSIVNGMESLGAQTFGMRPNTIRTAVPFRAPDFQDKLKEAAQLWAKNNPQAYNDGNFSGTIPIDALGDGHAINLPLADVMAKSGMVSIDPTTGKPLKTPTRKEGNEKFDPQIFAGVKAQWMADHPGVQPDDKALATITEQAIKRTSAAEAKPVDPTLEAIRALNVQLLQGKLNGGGAAQDNQDTLAQMLLDGRILPSQMSKRASDYNGTLAKADQASRAQTGKPLNLAKLQLDYEAAKKFVGTMNGSQQVRFKGLANSVVNTIDEVKRLSAELQQGGVQFYNKARRDTVLNLFGNSPQSETAAQYLGAVNTLKEEFASLVQGGYAPTEGAFNLANQQVNGNYSLKDMNASLNEVQRLINYRLGAFDDLKPTTVGSSSNQPTINPISATSAVGDVVKLPDGRVVTITEKTRTGYKFKEQ